MMERLFWNFWGWVQGSRNMREKARLEGDPPVPVASMDVIWIGHHLPRRATPKFLSHKTVTKVKWLFQAATSLWWLPIDNKLKLEPNKMQKKKKSIYRYLMHWTNQNKFTVCRNSFFLMLSLISLRIKAQNLVKTQFGNPCPSEKITSAAAILTGNCVLSQDIYRRGLRSCYI